MSDQAGVSRYSYDAAGRITSVSGPLTSANLSYKWDPDGQMTERDINAVPETFSYDNMVA